MKRRLTSTLRLQNPGETNPENNPNTFGQLVPMFLNLLLVFAILQFVSEQFKQRRNRHLARSYFGNREFDEAEMAAREALDPYAGVRGSGETMGKISKKSTADVVVRPAADGLVAGPDAIQPNVEQVATNGGKSKTLRKSSFPKEK